MEHLFHTIYEYTTEFSRKVSFESLLSYSSSNFLHIHMLSLSVQGRMMSQNSCLRSDRLRPQPQYLNSSLANVVPAPASQLKQLFLLLLLMKLGSDIPPTTSIHRLQAGISTIRMF